MIDSETEYRLEEQDLRILKNILGDPVIANDFASAYDESIFLGAAKDVIKETLAYINVYKTPPTKRILLERAGTQADKFSVVLEALDEIDGNSIEYQYDLDKLKNRYAANKIWSLREVLDQPIEQSEFPQLIDEILSEMEAVKQIQSPTRRTYTQKTLKSFMPDFKGLYAEKVKNPELSHGILTNYSFLDFCKNGFNPSEMCVIAADTGAGKALPLDTPILTPNGFKNLGELHSGDEVFGRDGQVCKILAESEIWNSEGYEFTFNDGVKIISHPNHEWLTFNNSELQQLTKRKPEIREKYKKNRPSQAIKNTKPWLIEANKKRAYVYKSPPTGSIRTTQEIIDTLYIYKNKRNNHAIPFCKPLILPDKKLIIDPYILGAWLGDGHKQDGVITSMDLEIIANVTPKYKVTKITKQKNKKGKISLGRMYRFAGLITDLRKVGVFKNKYIPQDYLLGSYEQRLALLQGLMDTDGTATKSGNLQFDNTNKKIIDGVVFLINSLGEKCSVTQGVAKLYGKIVGPTWTVFFTPSFKSFRLTRKLNRQALAKLRLNKIRYITKAEKTPPTEMKCIQVSSSDNMFLAGPNLIPTHNSMMLSNMAIQMWMQKNTLHSTEFSKGHNVLYFSLEMPYEACARRAMARIANVPMYGIRDAKLSTVDFEMLESATDFIGRYPNEFEIVDIARGATLSQIEARFLEARRKFNPEIVVVDYLGLMEDKSQPGADDWLKLGNIANGLHEFARYYGIVLLTAVQLNRVSKTASSAETIGMHRIGRSSMIMHAADLGIQIESRPDESVHADLLYHIIKIRDGEMGHARLHKNFKNASLTDDFFATVADSGGSTNDQTDDLSGLLEKYGWNKKC